MIARVRSCMIGGAFGIVVVVCAMLIATSPSGRAATSTSVVGATVASVGWLDASGCASNTPGVTSFGSVLPGSSTVTSADCVLKFGSSNDTAMLRVRQRDAIASAMWRPPTGTLDTSFNATGQRAIDLGSADDQATAIERQPDGKLLVAGYNATPANGTGYLARINPDGSFDTTFAPPNGYLTINLSAGDDTVYDLALQVDGKVLVAIRDATNDDWLVARYTATGALDTAGFAAPNGYARVLNIGGFSAPRTLGVLSDGSIVLAGDDYNLSSESAVCIARLTSTGVLDAAFDGDPIASSPRNGYVCIDVDPNQNEVPYDLKIGDGDAIYVIGAQTRGGASYFMYAMRLLSDGRTDSSYDGDGIALLNTEANTSRDERFAAGALQADGKLVLTGTVARSTGTVAQDVILARFTTSGALDTTFAAPTGYAFLDFGNSDWEWGTDVKILDDGRIWVTGVSWISSWAPFTARYNADGTLDTSYDGDGWKRESIVARASSDQPAVRTVLGRDGDATIVSHESDLTVTQFGDVPVDDYLDDGSADWDTVGSLDLFGACLRAVANGATGGGTGWPLGPAGACPATDGTYWNAIPATTSGSKVAATLVPDTQGGATDPTAYLRFGLRTTSSQPAGGYIAPITFDVVAPDA